MRDYFINLLRQVRPDITIKEGSPLYSLLIDPLVAIYSYFASKLTDRLELSTQDMADFFLVGSSSAQEAEFILRLYFVSPINLDFDADAMIFESGSSEYYNKYPVHVSASTMQMYMEDSFYYTDIQCYGATPITASSSFSWNNPTEKYSFLALTGVSNYGALAETSAELEERVRRLLYNRTLTTKNSIVAWFYDQLGNWLSDISVIGFEDFDMTRNEVDISGSIYKLPGYIDTYIKGTYPEKYTKEIEFYKIADWELESSCSIAFLDPEMLVNNGVNSSYHLTQYLWRPYVTELVSVTSAIRADDGTYYSDPATQTKMSFADNSDFDLDADNGYVGWHDHDTSDDKYIIADMSFTHTISSTDFELRYFIDSSDDTVIWAVLYNTSLSTWKSFGNSSAPDTSNLNSLDDWFYEGMVLRSEHHVTTPRPQTYFDTYVILSVERPSAYPSGTVASGLHNPIKIKLSHSLSTGLALADGSDYAYTGVLYRFEPVEFSFKYHPFGCKFSDIDTPLLWIDQIASTQGLPDIGKHVGGFGTLGYSTAGYSGYDDVFWLGHVKDPDYRYSMLEEGIIEVLGPGRYIGGTVRTLLHDYLNAPNNKMAITYRYGEGVSDIQAKVDANQDIGSSHIVKHFVPAGIIFDELDINISSDVEYSDVWLSDFLWSLSDTVEFSDMIDKFYDNGATYIDLDDLINNVYAVRWNTDGTFTSYFPDEHGVLAISDSVTRFILDSAQVNTNA